MLDKFIDERGFADLDTPPISVESRNPSIPFAIQTTERGWGGVLI